MCVDKNKSWPDYYMKVEHCVSQFKNSLTLLCIVLWYVISLIVCRQLKNIILGLHKNTYNNYKYSWDLGLGIIKANKVVCDNYYHIQLCLLLSVSSTP